MTSECRHRILIYAHYYSPDVASTGQILQDIAEGLTEEFDVTVICTVPSYLGVIEDKYKDKKFYKESLNGVKIIRVSVPEFSKSSKVSRIKNLFVYQINARRATKLAGDQDYVFALSQPPILGGMLGVYGKEKLRTPKGNHPKFIYNIQDFNPEQIEAVGYIKVKLLLKIAKWLDKRTCRKSDLIITVGRDLVDTLKNRFKGTQGPNHIMINNWADERILYPLSTDDPIVKDFREQYGLLDKFVFMYSGNLGLYYDLDGLIKVIERFKNTKTKDGRDVAFAFVGAGSMLKNLIEYKNAHQLDNVVFIPYQDKDKLLFSLNAADVHLCVSARGIKGVSCPSKFYGILAVGKPTLAIVERGSEIELLMRDTNCGKVAEPGDYNSIEKYITWFIGCSNSEIITDLGKRGRDYLDRHLIKKKSIGKYIESIKKC